MGLSLLEGSYSTGAPEGQNTQSTCDQVTIPHHPEQGSQWDSDCFHCSHHPWGQSTAVFSKAYTEEHPRRQSQVNFPSFGGYPSLAGERKSQRNSLSQENSAKAQVKPEGKAFPTDSPRSVALPFSVPLSHERHLSSQGMCRCLPKYCSQTFPWHSVGSWVSQPPPTSKALQVLSHVQCRQH